MLKMQALLLFIIILLFYDIDFVWHHLSENTGNNIVLSYEICICVCSKSKQELPLYQHKNKMITKNKKLKIQSCQGNCQNE